MKIGCFLFYENYSSSVSLVAVAVIGVHIILLFGLVVPNTRWHQWTSSSDSAWTTSYHYAKKKGNNKEESMSWLLLFLVPQDWIWNEQQWNCFEIQSNVLLQNQLCAIVFVSHLDKLLSDTLSMRHILQCYSTSCSRSQTGAISICSSLTEKTHFCLS